MKLINTENILVLALVSFSLVLITGFPSEAKAGGASLYLSPPSGTYTVGSVFEITVKINSGGQSINAAEANLVFNPAELSVVNISKTNSIFSLWTTEPTFSNVTGKISFGGGSPLPFSGDAGTIVTISFKAKSPSSALVNFSSGSILAADGKGTNILSNMIGGVYTLKSKVIIPLFKEIPPEEYTTSGVSGVVPLVPVVKSSTHPDPDKWYSETNAEFYWKVPPGVNTVALLINRSPISNPTVYYSPPISQKRIDDLEDGVWYFHIRFKNSSGWGAVLHRKVLVDTNPPEPFEIKIDNEGDPTNPSPLLIFESEDEVSGVEKYEIKIDQRKAIVVSSEEIKQKGYYKPPPLAPGEHSIIVRAIDYAGNYSLAMISVDIKPIASPQILDYPKRIYPGENIIIAGIVPNCEKCDKIIIYLQNERKELIRSIAKVEQGKWEDIIERALDRGVYTATAVAVDNRGAQSLPSKKIKILVSSPVFVKIGNLVIDYLSVLVTCLALIIFMIIVWIYGWKKIKDLKARLKKETTEAEATLYQAFEILRQTVEEQVAKFDKRKGLSKKEREIRDSLWKSLVEARSKIGKEITDINVQLQNKKRHSNRKLIKNKK